MENYNTLNFSNMSPKNEYNEDTDSKHYQLLEALVNTYDLNTHDHVERISKRWNPVVRDYLRAETGFRFSYAIEKEKSNRFPASSKRRSQETIPVTVSDGLPISFSHVVSKFKPIIWRLLAHRSLLEQTYKGIDLIIQEYPEISKEFGMEETRLQDIESTRAIIGKILERLAQEKLAEELLGIQEDVLGAYFYRIPEIRLYWVAIGAIASILNVSLEGLTVVVLVHELAHAYSHRGFDIDGGQWATESFHHAELGIVEGLAQYYTDVVSSKRLIERFPEALDAYTKLLALQGGPYQVHTEWLKDNKKAGEIIRFTMLNTRLKNILSYSDFLSEMDTVKEMVIKASDKP